MAQRGLGDEVRRSVTALFTRAAADFDRSKADAVAAGRKWVRDVAQNADAAMGQFGENLAFSQAAQRQAIRAVAPEVRLKKAETPTRKPTTVPRKATAKPREEERSLAGRAAAGVDAFVDTASLDAVDHLAAIQRAVRGLGPTSDVLENYRWWVAKSEAEDAEYARLYPNTDRVAQVAGTVVPILLSGGISVAPQGFVRLAPLAVKSSGTGVRGLAQRFGPQAAISTLGGTASAGTQVVTDLIDPTRSVNATDAMSAFAGGSVGTLATLYGSPRVGAVAEAATTELTRSALSDEPISWDAIQDGAIAGAYAGRIAGGLGAKWSNDLPSFKGSVRQGAKRGPFRSKEELGDFLGETLSRLRMEGVKKRQVYFDVSGGRTRADHVTNDWLPRENKFGFGASHSDRQMEAIFELPAYRTHHFTPDDMGKGFGGAAGLLFGQAFSGPEYPLSQP